MRQTFNRIQIHRVKKLLDQEKYKEAALISLEVGQWVDILIEKELSVKAVEVLFRQIVPVIYSSSNVMHWYQNLDVENTNLFPVLIKNIQKIREEEQFRMF